ncbi:hypothetical protein [Streptomyces sp. NPDC095817]|uniref:P-type ATPase n=1 Tax=Streptomyces sp. NPDC095817 TaxID=3155082 RepID=UPI00332310D0
MQAENAVEALAAFLPPTAHVVRDNVRCDIAAKDLGPGDILIVSEGDRVCADARIVEGTLTLDLSSLTGGRACMHTELGRPSPPCHSAFIRSAAPWRSRCGGPPGSSPSSLPSSARPSARRSRRRAGVERGRRPGRPPAGGRCRRSAGPPGWCPGRR